MANNKKGGFEFKGGFSAGTGGAGTSEDDLVVSAVISTSTRRGCSFVFSDDPFPVLFVFAAYVALQQRVKDGPWQEGRCRRRR